MFIKNWQWAEFASEARNILEVLSDKDKKEKTEEQANNNSDSL